MVSKHRSKSYRKGVKSHRKSSRKSKTRKGGFHPAATLVVKPNNYSPFRFASPEEAEEIFEARNVYKL